MKKLFGLGTPGAQALGVFLAVFCISPLAYSKTIVVNIDGMKFSPPAVDAKVGDTVVWKNNDILPHTATTDPGGPKFDSGMIQPGKSFKLKVREVGKASYHCAYHPTMLGEIRSKK